MFLVYLLVGGKRAKRPGSGRRKCRIAYEERVWQRKSWIIWRMKKVDRSTRRPMCSKKRGAKGKGL